jgi:hypothetical protein
MSAGTDPSRPKKTTLPTTDQTNRDDQTGNTLNHFIAEQVIQSLGSPTDLFKVQVRPIGSERYRVNVVVGKDFTTARIVDSFFLTADDEGKILASSPEIARLY